MNRTRASEVRNVAAMPRNIWMPGSNLLAGGGTGEWGIPHAQQA